MSSENDSSEQTYSDQLLDFESQLRHTMDDESLLQDVFRAIRELLKDHQESESDIRKILHDRFETGQLREETFQVVQRMLDRIVSDFVATLPGDISGKGFVDTDVIPSETLDTETPADRLQAGSVLRDRFLLQQEVAGGSMGVVYKALDRRLAEVDEADPWVAIKVLTPKLSRNANALRAMQQEAAKGRCLSHPNIVRFIDLDREDDLYFIVMEWIEGRALAAVLDDPNTDTIDLDTTLEIVRQVGRALDYAHRCGVVHADVKPGNVMIMPDGNVKLIDFGVARIRQQQLKSASKFDPAVLGAATPAYSSMQVLTGEDPVPADDVFSLGCLTYRLAAGYRVFGPRNAAEAAQEGMVPQRPQGLSDRQWRALKKSLAFARVARFASPKAFLDDLSGRRPEGPVAEENEETILDMVDHEEPRRWPIGMGLVAIAAGLGYVGTQTNLLDEYLDRLQPLTRSSPPSAVVETPVDAAYAEDVGLITSANDGAELMTDVSPSPVSDRVAGEVAEGVPDPADFLADDIFAEAAVPEPQADATIATGFAAAVPDAIGEPISESTHTLTLATSNGPGIELNIVLREDGESAVVDVNRDFETALPLSLRVEEVGFSGNRSPWESGQYTVADDGVIEFAVGQTSTQTTISMMSDPLREADRQVDLVIREADVPDRDLARIKLVLEDDDQRQFESTLSRNTVAFAVSQVSVGENDPVVQIDVLRFNPDAQAVDVEYLVQDVTATEGEDYFAPRIKMISFAPGQRTARLLIPLVQDSAHESDEAFFLEIAGASPDAEANIFRRIAVMIRDDDS